MNKYLLFPAFLLSSLSVFSQHSLTDKYNMMRAGDEIVVTECP